MTVRIIHGDCRNVLRTLPDASVQCCVTSPPYYGLRDYGVAGQIGLEKSPADYVDEMVTVFAEVRRVLRDDGVCWLNLGDSYANDAKWGGSSGGKHVHALHGSTGVGRGKKATGAKPKDLLMIPARVAISLQANGWWLRSDVIWHKPNPMPESVTDRPTAAHEHVFLLTKSERYFYDADAIRQPASEAFAEQINAGYGGVDTKDFAVAGAQSASGTKSRIVANARAKIDKQRGHSRRHDGLNDRWDAMSKAEQQMLGSNARNVWTIGTQPFVGAHFAVMPPPLAERCILAGSRPGDTILDPFSGAGTTALVADRLNRHAIGIELNPAYRDLASDRITTDAPLFAQVAAE